MKNMSARDSRAEPVPGEAAREAQWRNARREFRALEREDPRRAELLLVEFARNIKVARELVNA
jgi:hypothetical protein